MEELVILDYSTSEVHIYKLDYDTDINEDYIKKLGFNINTCFWMFGTNIKIIKHSEILK